MSKAEDAAFAAMQEVTSAPVEPEPADDQAEPEAAAPPAEDEEGEAPEAEAEGERKPERGQFVPHAAFHEERRIRQQFEAENRRMSEERARIDERLRIIEEMNRPQPPEAPAWAVDPIAAGEHLQQRIERLEQGWQQGSQQWTEQQQRAAQLQQIAQAASADADRFKAQTKDYDDAYRFWLQSRANEMQAFGVDPSRIVAELQQEEMDLATNAFQRRVSPAETLYTIARQRGYKAGNGHANTADRQIERVATGQERNRTLSGTGGGAAPVQMTATLLATMSNEDFDVWVSKNPRAADRLMGKEPARGRGR
jgi:hypothetical protein